MKNYVYEEISLKEFQNFVSHSSQNQFMQSSSMKKYYDLKKHENYTIGVKENGKLVASALIYLESTFLGYKKFAIYKGFVLDYNNEELLKFITDETKKFLKSKNAYMFTIDPNIIEIERDTDAKVVDNAKNNYAVIDYLKKLGYKKSKKDVQIKWTYIKDINGMTSDEMFKTFKQNTRNIINRTINKYKLNIRDVKYEDLSEFKKVTQDTCERRGFNDKSLTYYQNMKKAFKDDVIFKISELNCDEYLSDLYNEKSDYESKIEKIALNNSKKENYKKELGNVLKKIDEVEKLKKDKGNIIPLSCAMFILYGDEIIYFSSGSYKEYMQYYGQYILQWEMIKYACDKKYKRYNFYGIMDVFDKSGKDYGVYEFKKGFNGYVKELLGEYEYYINKKIMLLKNIKEVVKH